MKRSLPAVLALFAAVCGTSVAHADLDSLLGEWAAAATQDANHADDLSLSPVAEVNSQFSDNRQATTSTRASNSPQSAAKPLPTTGKTLASHSGHEHQGDQLTAQPQADFYEPDAPTANPYYIPTTSDGDCDGQTGSRKCGGGGSCGELIATNRPCHCEGQSECRPHRRPLLPPPSTILQMFRSKNTYSTIWAGYADETRTRLRNTSPHLNGTWNACGNAGGLIEPGCNTCNSDCDQ